jgi:hypothetical protein
VVRFQDQLCQIPVLPHEEERHSQLLQAFEDYAIGLAVLLEAMAEQPLLYHPAVLGRLKDADEVVRWHRQTARRGSPITTLAVSRGQLIAPGDSVTFRSGSPTWRQTAEHPQIFSRHPGEPRSGLTVRAR